MSLYFDQQQEYIHTLQVQLNQGIADKDYITSLWSEAKEDKVWDETPGFEIRLRGYGRIWGKAANEHAAWTMARKNLDNEGVLSAFQKMDKNDGSA